MLKKSMIVFILFSLLLGNFIPNQVAFAEEYLEDSDEVPAKSEKKRNKKAESTIEWIADELEGKRSKKFDPSDIPNLTERKISEMTWDQLSLEDVKNIHYLYDRETLQIAAYFYSNLERLLSYEEVRETYDWDDEDVINKISKLPQDQMTFLFTYTPTIGSIYNQFREEKSLKSTNSANPAASLPDGVKYTQKDQKWNYENRNVSNPVDDLYQSSNVVEQDLVLPGKHGMDLVLVRTYSSMNSKVSFPGYGESNNVVYEDIFSNDDIPFAAGWEFNIPSFTYSNYDLTTKLESFPSMERYSKEGDDLNSGQYKWFVKLDDGSSLETQYHSLDNWKNYAYRGIHFQYAYDGSSAKLTKNGITYQYRYSRASDDGTTITKTNPQGDRITYFIPNRSTADIEITDTVGRFILLKKNGPYSSISDVEVYADSTKSELLKRIHYSATAMASGVYDYVQLEQVTEYSPTNESKIVSQYQYHDPSVKGRAEFNFERSYELNSPLGNLDTWSVI
ncbi:hypothetical protein [Brevibacillus invocatus]